MSDEHDCPFSNSISRRGFLAGTVAAAAAVSASSAALAQGNAPKAPPPPVSLIARPPAGFVPWAAPGLVVKASKANSLQANKLWPTEEAARLTLERAMAELTGEQDMGKAFGKFVHAGDKVAIKVNGIGGQTGATMGTNKELILEIVKGVLAAGIAASDLYIYEQYPSFLRGTRISDAVLPAGVKSYTHNGIDAQMPEIRVHNIGTRFVRQLLEATAVINVALIKDHTICGYTGCLKNMTHGSVINPEAFHGNLMNPQVPLLYSHQAIKSRVRLNITDGFKLMYNGGPLGKDRLARVPHEAVYVSTDPVAMDMVGWQVVDKWRRDKGLPTLKDSKREPAYIRVAGDMGLGIADLNRIRLKEFNA